MVISTEGVVAVGFSLGIGCSPQAAKSITERIMRGLKKNCAIISVRFYSLSRRLLQIYIYL
jgi:hypothetical protein